MRVNQGITQPRCVPESGASTTDDHGTDWTFGGTWPYAPKWFETPDGRVHYVDEGPRDAPAVVLVHGNPTWGYLYREFIPPLVRAGFRVVMPDLLGFGRSDKPSRVEAYGIPRHAQRLEALLESLDLRDVTLVPQDWGGPVGLYWAGRHPERIARLFILNTWAHRTVGKYRPPLALRLFRTPVVGELLVKGLHVFVRGFLFGQGTRKHERLTKTVRRAYVTPHPGWSDRTGVLAFPRQIPVTPDAPLSPWMAEVEASLAGLGDKPVMLAWGMEDPIFTPDFVNNYWKRSFPGAHVLRIAGAGHYLQEDGHETIVPALMNFLQDRRVTPSSGTGLPSDHLNGDKP